MIASVLVKLGLGPVQSQAVQMTMGAVILVTNCRGYRTLDCQNEQAIR